MELGAHVEVSDDRQIGQRGRHDQRGRGSSRRDLGATVLVVSVAVVLAALTAVATAELGVAMVHRQRAQLAADAAALAGLDGGRAAAVRLASLNGGRLVGYWQTGPTVTVEVRVAEASARARATNGP